MVLVYLLYLSESSIKLQDADAEGGMKDAVCRGQRNATAREIGRLGDWQICCIGNLRSPPINVLVGHVQ